jgi:hypothetical protein
MNLTLYQNFSSAVDAFFVAGHVDARTEKVVSGEDQEKAARQKRRLASVGFCCAAKAG